MSGHDTQDSQDFIGLDNAPGGKDEDSLLVVQRQNPGEGIGPANSIISSCSK